MKQLNSINVTGVRRDTRTADFMTDPAAAFALCFDQQLDAIEIMTTALESSKDIPNAIDKTRKEIDQATRNLIRRLEVLQNHFVNSIQTSVVSATDEAIKQLNCHASQSQFEILNSVKNLIQTALTANDAREKQLMKRMDLEAKLQRAQIDADAKIAIAITDAWSEAQAQIDDRMWIGFRLKLKRTIRKLKK